MEKLKIGEKVLMFEVSYKDDGKIDIYKTFVENPYEEVTVIKYNDEVSNVVTVISEKGKEYSGTYFIDEEKEKYCFLRRQEFINGLRNFSYKQWDRDRIRKIYERINRMCDHLFVKLREGYTSPGFHSSDYEYVEPRIKCLHCGLTNWWEGLNPLYKTTHDEMLDEAYYDYIRTFCPSDARFDKGDTSWIPFISKEAHCFIKPEEYYLKAKELKPDATNEELFCLMKQIEDESVERNRKSWEEVEEKEKVKK